MIGGNVKGLADLVHNAKKAEAKAAAGIEAGLKAAGKFLLGESQKVVPVDTGELQSSGYTKSSGSGFGTRAFVGYTAGHATAVHEDLSAEHDNGKAKFIEDPARKNRRELTRIAGQRVL